MNSPGSLCPTVKASEMLGDKWTLLILRELFLGSSRYTQFQNALPRISPTVLSNRLKQMEKNGLVIRKAKAGKKGGEYRLTRSAMELAPIIDSLARWGLHWARDQLCDIDLDVGTFMWDFNRTLNTEQLPDGRSTFSVLLTDQKAKQWWLLAQDNTMDLCNEDPGHEVDLYITSTLTELASIWMGDTPIQSALKRKSLLLTGASYLIKSAEQWFPRSRYSEVRPKKKKP